MAVGSADLRPVYAPLGEWRGRCLPKATFLRVPDNPVNGPGKHYGITAGAIRLKTRHTGNAGPRRLESELSESLVESPENHRSLLLTDGHIEEPLRGGIAHGGVTCLHPIARIIQLHGEHNLGRSGLVTPLEASIRNL